VDRHGFQNGRTGVTGSEKVADKVSGQSARVGRNGSVTFLPPQGHLTPDIADIADKSMFPMVLAFFTPDKGAVCHVWKVDLRQCFQGCQGCQGIEKRGPRISRKSGSRFQPLGDGVNLGWFLPPQAYFNP